MGNDPTGNRAIANVDGAALVFRYVRSGTVSGLRPMRVDRLIASGAILTEAEQARVKLHWLGDVDQVAAEMGQSVTWVRQACARDIEQRRIQSAS